MSGKDCSLLWYRFFDIFILLIEVSVSEAKLADWLVVKNVAFNVNEVLKIIDR